MKVRIAASAAFPLAFTPYTLHYTLKNKVLKFMKKNYITPQTEAIELLGANAIMAGSGANFIPTGANVGGEYGD